MTAILTKKVPASETRNTFNLPTGGAIRRELVQVFREQRRTVLGYMAEFKSWDGLEFKTRLPVAWLPWERFGLGAASIASRLGSFIKSIWDKAGAAFLALIGRDPDAWDITNPAIEALIERDVLDLTTEINTTTSQQLQAALDAATNEVEAGTATVEQAEAELTKSVNEIFDDAESRRALTIAATEASRAYHAAQDTAAIESGDVAGWKWLTSEGACQICLEIEAECQFVPLGRRFAVIGSNQTYQDVFYPPAHPNCMCSVEEVLMSDDQPDWGQTLVQPRPAKKDYGFDDAPAGVKSWPNPRAFPRPAIRRRVLSDS